MQDLGGKHGTHVNGVKMEKRGTVILKDGDRVVFGNVRDQIFVLESGNSAPDSCSETSSLFKTMEKEDRGKAIEQENIQPSRTIIKTAGEGLSGRAKREAEIQAMMESLDTTPEYQKYRAANEESTDTHTRGIGSGKSAAHSVILGVVEQQKSQLSASQSIATQYALPISCNTSIQQNETDTKSKVLNALSLDPAGSRLATGCSDTHLRLYDFGGMDNRHKHFKEIEVEEGHPIVDVCHSNSGDRIVVCTGSAQPKILDRDGFEIITFIKGDVYVTDQSRTTGHTASVTSVCWHPLERDIVLTSSIDGSARLWNLNGKTQFKKLVCDKVYRAKNERGQRIGVTSAVFHPAGRELALGTACGSIQIWNATRVGTRPDRALYNAHGKDVPVNALVYNADGTKLASRSMDDDTVKVWEQRKICRSAAPLLICQGLPSFYEKADCAFSSNSKILCAGTSIPPGKKGTKQEGCGKLKFYNVPTGRENESNGLPVLELDVAPGSSVIRVVWHPKLNQIFGSCSDGRTFIFYDSKLSSNGALLSTAKVARKKDELSVLLASRAPQGSAGITGPIMTPHALPMFRDVERETKRKREKERMDPVKSKRPEPPAAGVKTGGQSSAQSTFTQIVAKSIIKEKNIAGKDPREELFQYSTGKSYVEKAYEGDQQHVLSDKTAEQEEEEMKAKRNKR